MSNLRMLKRRGVQCHDHQERQAISFMSSVYHGYTSRSTYLMRMISPSRAIITYILTYYNETVSKQEGFFLQKNQGETDGQGDLGPGWWIHEYSLPPAKTNNSPLKTGHLKRTFHLTTIHFQVLLLLVSGAGYVIAKMFVFLIPKPWGFMGFN